MSTLLTDGRLPDFYKTALLACRVKVLIGHTDDMAISRLQSRGAFSVDHGVIDKDSPSSLSSAVLFLIVIRSGIRVALLL